MAAAGDRLLGYVAWYTARWYVRRRVRAARRALRLGGAALAGALVLAGVIARLRSK